MTHYKVKATVEVEYDAEYTDKMAGALEEAEDLIVVTLLKIDTVRSCEFKKVEVLMEDY